MKYYFFMTGTMLVYTTSHREYKKLIKRKGFEYKGFLTIDIASQCGGPLLHEYNNTINYL